MSARADDGETPIHIAIYEYLVAALPSSARVAHIPNGGKRGKREAAELKRMGVLPGFPDLLILTITGQILFIEVKSAVGVLSKRQKDFCQFCAAAGFAFGVARSVDDARALLHGAGIKTREARS